MRQERCRVLGPKQGIGGRPCDPSGWPARANSCPKSWHRHRTAAWEDNLPGCFLGKVFTRRPARAGAGW